MRMTDTIVAVSSPPGRSARAIVRLSGPGCRQTVHALTAAPPPAHPPAPRRLTPIRLRLPRADTPGRTVELPALLAFFPGPASYTGQDMAELQTPGNPALLDRLLHACLSLPGRRPHDGGDDGGQAGRDGSGNRGGQDHENGAPENAPPESDTRAVDTVVRLAEPGEFTFRAFVAGKIDLTQAEGVAATIAAESDSQLRAATDLRHGQLGQHAAAMADRLANLLAMVEAGVDFTDQEDVVPIAPADLRLGLQTLADELNGILANTRRWAELDALPRVVLAGAPSVGKSTLFNALLGRPRAVADPMPGTTRDVLAEPLHLPLPHGRDIEIMLIDIAGLSPAGLSPAARSLDAHAQQAARDAMARADVVLWLHDAASHPSASHPPADTTPTDTTPTDRATHTVVIPIRAKADLTDPPAHASSRPTDSRSTDSRLAISAVTGQGLDALRSQLAHALAHRADNAAAQTLVLQPRHERALRDAAAHLNEACPLLPPPDSVALRHPELIAAALRQALDALGALGGHMTPDDVLGRVFATFCVGK